MIILVHGWGFEPTLWDAVEDHLAAIPGLPRRRRLDLGLFSAADNILPASDQITLAVGHSYGALWLLQRCPPSVPMLAVNGFARFCSGDGQAEGTPPRVLDRMRARLSGDPQGTLDAFRARCGAPPADRPGLSEPLAAGLTALRQDDARPPLALRRATAPHGLFALGGDADPIVPPALAVEAFGTAPQTTLVTGGGHLLPLTHPQAVAAAICAALNATP
jgi:pimeloyl-[acyl-carrier protein] methyl ester esterase